MLHFIGPHPRHNDALASQVHFLVPAGGDKNGADIGDLFRKNLYDTTGYDFDSFMNRFTLLSDSAAVMQILHGASGSENFAFQDERCSPCFAHMLIMIMK